MICDLAQDGQIPSFAADVCIVGAGAAGITLAAELARQGKRVLLLESGGRELEEDVQRLNLCEKKGHPLKAPHPGRFRVLGGTTTRWGGQILEMQEQDFEARAAAPGSGWPIQKATLQPYYQRALQAEGLIPVLQADEEVWRRAGVSMPVFGEGIVSYVTRWCPEPNFFRLHRELFGSPDLCVVLHATACSMLLDAEGRAVVGIRCRDLSGKERIFHAQKYVLCLGMMETINLLLQPLECGKIAPWQQNKWLGQHVQSHIDYNAAKVVPIDQKRLADIFSSIYRNGRKYHPKLRLDAQAQRKDGILSIAGTLACISRVESEVRQVKVAARNLLRGNISALGWRDGKQAFLLWPILLRVGYNYLAHHRAYWPANATYWLRVHCEQEPLSASRITLSAERNALGMFRSRLDWHISPLEWKTIQKFTAMAQRALEDAGLATLEPQPELALEDGYRSVTFDDSYHWAGGTRMAASATDGVVDLNLKLHGLKNAYVCSSSVFPTSGFANPVHTLLALTLRLADHLAGMESSV